MGFIVSGTVAKVSENAYDFTDESGQRRQGVSRKARVFDPTSGEFVDVKFPEGEALPAKGQQVQLHVEAGTAVKFAGYVQSVQSVKAG